MLYTATKAILLLLAIIGFISFAQAQASSPKLKEAKLFARIYQQALKPLNRVSMVEINVFNLFQPQLIHQNHVGLASNRLSIVFLPSNFQKSERQAQLLSDYNVKEQTVSAKEGDVVNQAEVVTKSEIMLVKDNTGDVHFVRTSPIALKSEGQILLLEAKIGH